MKSRLVISIDYDETWTDDPELWLDVAELMRARGHIVVMCTSRFRTNPVDGVPAWIEVFYAEGQMKAKFMEGAGLVPSIWIDDRPDTIGRAWT